MNSRRSLLEAVVIVLLVTLLTAIITYNLTISGNPCPSPTTVAVERSYDDLPPTLTVTRVEIVTEPDLRGNNLELPPPLRYAIIYWEGEQGANISILSERYAEEIEGLVKEIDPQRVGLFQSFVDQAERGGEHIVH